MDRARTARLEVVTGDALVQRFCAPRGAAAHPRDDAALAAELDAVLARAPRELVLAAPRADHPALAALVARARAARAVPITVECAGPGLTAETLAALGADRLRVVHGGMRRRVYEVVMAAPGTWEDAARGLAAALASAVAVDVIVPVLAWNLDDLVPLVDWLRALPGRVDRVLLAVPRAADTPAGRRRALADHAAIAPVAAAVFALCRRWKLGHGFDGGDAIWPCAAGEHLDGFGTVFHDHLRRAEHEPDRALARVDACATCSLRESCRGVEPTYLETFGAAALTPVPLARSARWRLRPIHGRTEVDYQQTSPFDNHGAGRGRTLLRINGHCQMACAFCFVDRSAGDRPLAELTAELDALAARHTDHVVFSGGEPTIHPDLPALIRHAAAAGYTTIEIQTNGVRCADPAYARTLVDAGLTKATVSLHSLDPATSDAITRMPGAFPRTIAGLDALAALGVETQLAHVITRENFRALPAFTDGVLDRFAGPGRRLSICFAIAQGISDLVSRWVLPTFTEIRPYVRDALDRCDARGVGYGGLVGQGGYPPCMLDGELRYYRGVLDKIYKSADADAQFAKAPTCARCDFDPYCLGVRRDYLAHHGDAELVPFRIAPGSLADIPAPRDPTLVPLRRR